jgi:catechol 2,3-dioxygenase-like lactoylglutathione lyase family enzyme
MATVTVSGLNVLAIYVSDLERAVAFYVDQLGFERKEPMPPGLLLQAGELTVYLEGERQERPGPGIQEVGISACFAIAGGVRAAHDRLQAAGVTIVEPYQEFAPTFGMCRIADPDGNVLELAGTP